jgi:hypothetical protein
MRVPRGWLALGSLALLIGVVATWTVVEASDAPGNARVDTSVQPFPDSARVSIEATWDELDRRVADWSAREGINQMTTEELVLGMDALTNSITNRDTSPDWWLVVHELGAKRGQLCVRLPEGHPYGEGEFC